MLYKTIEAILVMATLSIVSFLFGYYSAPGVIVVNIGEEVTWSDVVQTIIQGVGLITIYFVWRERVDNDKWSKLKETLYLTWSTPYLKLREKIISMERAGRINRSSNQMTTAQISELTQTEKTEVMDFLDHLEEICSGYLLNAFDKKYFESIWASIMIKNCNYFAPFIQHQRKVLNQKDLYSDLEKVSRVFNG